MCFFHDRTVQCNSNDKNLLFLRRTWSRNQWHASSLLYKNWIFIFVYLHQIVAQFVIIALPQANHWNRQGRADWKYSWKILDDSGTLSRSRHRNSPPKLGESSGLCLSVKEKISSHLRQNWISVLIRRTPLLKAGTQNISESHGTRKVNNKNRKTLNILQIKS